MSAALRLAVIDELRLCGGGKPPTVRELALALDCGAAFVAAAVQSLRYQGKVKWDTLELSDSLLEQGSGGSPPEGEGPEDGDASEGSAADLVTSPSSGPDDEDDEETPSPYPIETNAAARAERTTPAPAPERATGGPGAGFVPPRLLHQAGVHAAQTRAAAKPMPAPAHEPEVARQVREEVNANMARRHRARSTGSVRQPLALRKFGIADLSLGESIATMLAEEPHDLVVAITRTHPKLWRRIVLLARARGEQPAACLYAVLEAGLGQLEPQQEQAA